jgi:hypothetical protein
VALLAGLAGVLWLALRSPAKAVWLRSAVTGKEYEVRPGPTAQRRADRLADLELRLHDLLRRGETVAPGDDRLAAIRRRWDGTLAETHAAEDVAFSMDKRTVHVCLRGEDANAAMFVLLHELAHVATTDYGHSDAFWGNMRFLLELAERLGLYQYQDYAAAATTYCGHPLGASPLSCVKERTCASTLAAA